MSLRTFRNALIVMGAFLAVIWVLQIVNWADHYRLDIEFGILPDHVSRLPEIFTAPFLHFSWQHIEGNSVPLFVLGVLAAYRSLARFLVASLIIAVTSGLAVWLFQSGNELTVGASGLIFGYFGYVLVRGFFDRNLRRHRRRPGRRRAVLDDPLGGHPRHARGELDRPPRRPGRRRGRRLGAADADQQAGNGRPAGRRRAAGR